MKNYKTTIGIAILLFGLLIIAGCDAATDGLTGNAIGNYPSGAGSEQTTDTTDTTTTSNDGTSDGTYTTGDTTTEDDTMTTDTTTGTTDNTDTTSTDTTTGTTSGTSTYNNDNKDDSDDNTATTGTTTSTSGRTTTTVGRTTTTNDEDDSTSDLRFESYEVEATIMSLETQEVDEDYATTTMTTTTSSNNDNDDSTMTNDDDDSDDNTATTTGTTSASRIIFRSADGTTRVAGSDDEMMDVTGTIVIEEVLSDCTTGGLNDDCSEDLSEDDRLEVYFPQGADCSDDNDETMLCDDGSFDLQEGDTVRGTLQVDTDDDGYRRNRLTINSIS
jgi:hypothetical protein